MELLHQSTASLSSLSVTKLSLWTVFQQFVSRSPELAPQNPQVVFFPSPWFAPWKELPGTLPQEVPSLLCHTFWCPGDPVGHHGLRGRLLTPHSLCVPFIQQRVTEHLLLLGMVPGAHKEAMSEVAERTW